MKDKRLNELTVNDIIRKVRDRKERLQELPYLTARNLNVVDELEKLLNYIEKDEEYQ